MANIQRILCAVNVFHTSRRGFQQAVALARCTGASLTALYVCPVTFAPPIPGLADDVQTPERQRLTAEATDFVNSVDHTGVDVAVMVEEGDPLERILECAETRASDLLVVGVPERQGLDWPNHRLVAERLARRTSCPVLAVPPAGDDRAAGTPFQHILFATDFSVPSLHGLRYARSMSQDTGAHVCVLYVADWLPGSAPPDHGPQTLQEVRRFLGADAERRLTELAAIHALDGMDLHIGMGKPWREILRVAGACHSDLIVLGVHGGLDWHLLGSTTSHVMQEAACPVLTVRS